jgi:hypothetical protein
MLKAKQTGVELVLAQRRVDVLVDRVGHGDQVVEQQSFSVLFRDRSPGPRCQGVAIAQRPAPIGQLSGFHPVPFEPLDELDGGAGDLIARFHRLE